MRCLALAQAWKGLGGRVVYACCSLPDVFEKRLRQEGMAVHVMNGEGESPEDIRQTKSLSIEEKASVILVDLYQAKEHYLLSLRNPRWKTICLDDNAELPSYPVDFVLNQNAHADPALYASKCGNAVLLLGPGYALLRKEFSFYRKWERPSTDEPKNILISMGGGNQIPALFTLIDRLCPALRSLKLSIVLARSYENTGLLKDRLSQRGLDFQIILSPDNMARELAGHDLLISSGGAAVWEALFMQMPAFFVVIASNQTASCRALQRTVSHPVAFSMDSVSERPVLDLVHSAPLRAKLANEGRSLVDGRGAERVIEMLCS